MVRQGGGAIVNAASILGLHGVGGSALCRDETCWIGLTRAAALDYASSGIRINTMCLGATHTPGLLQLADVNAHAFDAKIPQRRLAQRHKIADAVAWLFPDEACYGTGAALTVVSGMSAR